MNCCAMKPVITILLLSMIIAPHVARAKQDHNGDTPTPKASTSQREAITSAALRALRDVTQARNAIHKNNKVEAQKNVQQAHKLLSLIEAARPTARLKEHIWVARQHMDYESAQDVIDDLTLVDAELLSLADRIPTAKAHRHLQSAQASMRKNDIKTARQELDRLEASLVVTEFDLPLAAGEQQVLLAQEALAKNLPTAADKNLAAAEEGLQFIALGGSAPMVSARVYLRRAAKNYAAKYYAAARADLAQASEWLHRAGRHADEKSRREIQKLASEINELQGKLGTETADHAHTLSAFLHRSMALIEREAESLWLRYKRQQAVNITLRKLLDAKTHLYYAEGGATETIRKELKTTDRYLEEALRNAEPGTRKRIAKLRDEVHALERDLESEHEKAMAHYEQAMADLVHLIHEQ